MADRNANRRAARPHGLTEAQYRLLAILGAYADEGTSALTVAKGLWPNAAGGATEAPASIIRMLTDLEALGMTERVSEPWRRNPGGWRVTKRGNDVFAAG
jgi:hypothetical protein